MSELIQRPSYIEYEKSGIEDGRYTQDDFDKLENEPAIFQWTTKRAFIFRETAWKIHLKVLSFLGLPLILSMLYSFFSSDNPDWSILGYNGIFAFSAFIMFLIYGFLYYISRSQYYHVVYKITESGMLRDELKLYPKFRYSRQDTTKIMIVLRCLSIPLIIMAIFIDPLLLAGAASSIFLSFMPAIVDEPERSYYVPIFWNACHHPVEVKLSIVNIVTKRRLIHVFSSNFSRGAVIFCTHDNFEAVKDFILNKMPNAKREHLISFK